MKRTALTIFALSLLVSGLAQDIYVSPDGKDMNPGTLDLPFASLERARDEARTFIREGLEEDVNVYLRGGTYKLDKTLVLGLKDSPGDEHKITFQSYPQGEAIISSGKSISGWKPYKDKVWVANLPQGLGCFRTLFDGTTRLPRARSEEISMPKNESIRRADSQNVLYNKDRIYLRTLPYKDEFIKNWKNLSDVEVVFNPVPWNMNIIQLESVDTINQVAYLAFEANAMPFTGHNGVAWVENVIDYLDEPGEWCVNTLEGKVYYWPESGKPSDQIMAPQLMEFIRVEGDIHYDLPADIPVKNIHFKDLTFMHGDRSVWYKNRKGWGIQHDWDTFDYGNAMLRFRGSEQCSVTGCHFTASGGSAMRFDLHAQNNIVEDNYIDYVGHMGILFCGYGPGSKDVNRNNIIRNNIIHHCGEVIWHGHAIFLWQSGENLIANNYVHDVPRKAIGLCGVRCQILMKPDIDFDEASKTIRWNEIEASIDSSLLPQARYAPYLHSRNNIVERNRAERTLMKLSDGSSINVSGAGMGNIIRYNLVYDIPVADGFRMDDWQDGTTIHYNIIHNAKGGIIHKGVNVVENNILINCRRGIHFRAYPQQYFIPESDIQRNILYSISTDFVPNTIFEWGRMFLHKEGTKPAPYEYNMDYNNYWFPGAEDYLKKQQENGIEAHGVSMDPKFADLENFDYRITNKKLIKALAFETWDTSIELYGVSADYPEKFSELDALYYINANTQNK